MSLSRLALLPSETRAVASVSGGRLAAAASLDARMVVNAVPCCCGAGAADAVAGKDGRRRQKRASAALRQRAAAARLGAVTMNDGDGDRRSSSDFEDRCTGETIRRE